MAYEGPPDMCYEWTPIIFGISLTFDPDMETNLKPPLTRWACIADGVPRAAVSFLWTDEHSAILEVLPIMPGPPAAVTLGYGPIHPGLQTRFDTVYPSWSPIAVPAC